MPPEEICFRPSRAKQTVGLAILFVVFILSTAGLLLLWPLDAGDFDNIVARTLVHNLKGIFIVVCAAFAALSVVGSPILVVIMVLNRPAFTLTHEGIRLSAGVLIRWEEIDEIHEYVDRTGPAPLRQVLIGLYLHDEEAIRARMSAAGRWQMNQAKKQGAPPILLTTHHLPQSTPEVLDEIEAYLEELQRNGEENRRWPEVYRRKE